MNNKLYIRTIDDWILFDSKLRTNINDFKPSEENYYEMVYNEITNVSYAQREKCRVLLGDKNAKLVTTVSEYFDISNKIKTNGLYLYNKKLGKAVLKK